MIKQVVEHRDLLYSQVNSSAAWSELLYWQIKGREHFKGQLQAVPTYPLIYFHVVFNVNTALLGHV